MDNEEAFDYEIILADRVGVIRDVNKKYNLEEKSYLSFSGGKDSTLLHYLLDIALPGNKIPRVYIDTGIEYLAIKEFVEELAKTDDRVEIIKPSKPIKATLEKYGYPFKSKEHASHVYDLQHGSKSKSTKKYFFGDGRFTCPQVLRYQAGTQFTLKVSPLCCHKLKKQPAKKYAKKTGRNVVLTGMRAAEGGQRANIGCILTDKNGNLKKFHPLLVVTDEWEDEFIKRGGYKICKLYLPPYNFKRTGCKGCPFNPDLAEQLSVMSLYLPAERKQCEIIWKPVYDEYRRIGYRLTKHEQIKLF